MAENDKFADEMLTDEQLEGVAGGTCYELADDSRFLNSLNNSTDRYGSAKMNLSHDKKFEIVGAWLKLGVIVFADKGFSDVHNKNAYFRMDNGKRLTQEEARQYAMEVTGHYMSRSEWDW